MTPKEKAIELVESMTFNCRECDYEIRAKYCAMRAVDELLDAIDWDYYEGSKHPELNYWREVKQEIEKL